MFRLALRDFTSSFVSGCAGSPRWFSRIDGYLHYYGKCKQHEGMLRDKARVDAYRVAIEAAASRLKGATVMDIGTGSGILAMLCAKYGAKKVYAIEGSPEIATVASRLARANGYVTVIEVVPKLLEEVTEQDIPQASVDVIVSELMSHFLVGETGLQVVTLAKNRFLKPDGLIMPAIGVLKVSPFSDPVLGAELRARHSFWNQTDFEGFDLTPALPLAIKQQLKELIIDVVDPAQLLVPPEESPAWVVDMATPDEPTIWNKMQHEFKVPRPEKGAMIDGICGWWDVIFEGAGPGRPILSTGPDAPPTVWAQCRFMLDKPLYAAPGANLTITCQLRLDKVRESYSAKFEFRNHSSGEAAFAGPIRLSDVYARHFAKPLAFPLIDGEYPREADPAVCHPLCS